MPKKMKVLTSNEMLEILNKQWLSSEDMQLLCATSRVKAIEIRKQIAKTLIDEGYYLPANMIPTEKAIEFLKLNVKYLRKMADQENERKKEVI